MDRSLAAALFAPRRLVITFLIAALLGAGTGSLVGVVRAQDTEVVAEVLPPPFALASPAAGDRGRYELEPNPAGLTADQRRAGFDEDRDHTIDFAIGDFEAQYDETGTPHWARRVKVATFEQRGDWNRSGSADVWVVGQAVVASFSERVDDPSSYQTTGLLPGQTGQTTSQTTWRTLSFSDVDLPCGLFDALQGTQAPMEGTLVRGGPECQWGVSDRNPNQHWTYFRGLNETGFLVVDHYTTHPSDQPRIDSEPEWRAFYRADIPYPVVMWNSWAEFGAPGDTLRLVGFERGQGMQAPPALALPPPLPPVLSLPRPQWTLDDTAVVHPFPLSAAFAYVRDDPAHADLREYLADHPDAYVHWARHAEFDVDGQHSHRWSFELTDGATRHQEVISRNVGNAVTLVPTLPGALPGVSYSYEEADHHAPFGDWTAVPSDRVPGLMPEVSSLLAVWGAIPTLSGNPDATSSWEFQVGCPDECDEVSVYITAGQTYYYREAEPGYPVIDNRLDVWDTSSLLWIDGALVSGTESEQVHTRQETPVTPPPGSPPPAETAAAALGPLPSPHWLAPTPAQAVGIGFGALLVAALYWLWPALKTGFVGLFSRVRTSDLLDDPTRALLLAAVEAEPGIHHQALVRLAGKGNGATEHHLQKLVAGGLVNRHRSEGYTCYFRAGKVDRRAMATAHLLKSPIARAVVEAASSRPGTSLAQVAREQGVSVPTVHYHAKRLQAAGLVRWEGGLHAAGGAAPLGSAAAAT